jgi:PAS domain S-box-containing protein
MADASWRADRAQDVEAPGDQRPFDSGAATQQQSPGGIAHETGELYRLLVESVDDYAIFALDPDGYILSWNAGAQRFKGYTADEAIGKHFSIFYPREKIEEGFPEFELKEAARVGRFEDEDWRIRKDGTRFWANVVITALRDAAGHLVGFGKVTRDLTERRLAEEALRESEERFRLLVQGVRDYAIFMLDPTGHITTWNAGAERIKCYTSDEIIGKHFSIFYTPEDLKSGKPARKKAGASARMEHASGQASSSLPCTNRMARSPVSPRSPGISPSAARHTSGRSKRPARPPPPTKQTAPRASSSPRCRTSCGPRSMPSAATPNCWRWACAGR